MYNVKVSLRQLISEVKHTVWMSVANRLMSTAGLKHESVLECIQYAFLFMTSRGLCKLVPDVFLVSVAISRPY